MECVAGVQYCHSGWGMVGYLFTALSVKPQVGTKIRRMEVLFRSSFCLMTATLEGEETPCRP